MKKLYRAYIVSLSLLLIMSMLTQPVFAASDLWSVARIAQQFVLRCKRFTAKNRFLSTDQEPMD